MYFWASLLSVVEVLFLVWLVLAWRKLGDYERLFHRHKDTWLAQIRTTHQEIRRLNRQLSAADGSVTALVRSFGIKGQIALWVVKQVKPTVKINPIS